MKTFTYVGQMALKSSVVVTTELERLGKELQRLFKVLPWQLSIGSEEGIDLEYVRQTLGRNSHVEM
jgi:hypothetical protein